MSESSPSFPNGVNGNGHPLPADWSLIEEDGAQLSQECERLVRLLSEAGRRRAAAVEEARRAADAAVQEAAAVRERATREAAEMMTCAQREIEKARSAMRATTAREAERILAAAHREAAEIVTRARADAGPLQRGLEAELEALRGGLRQTAALLTTALPRLEEILAQVRLGLSHERAEEGCREGRPHDAAVPPVAEAPDERTLAPDRTGPIIGSRRRPDRPGDGRQAQPPGPGMDSLSDLTRIPDS